MNKNYIIRFYLFIILLLLSLLFLKDVEIKEIKKELNTYKIPTQKEITFINNDVLFIPDNLPKLPKVTNIKIR